MKKLDAFTYAMSALAIGISALSLPGCATQDQKLFYKDIEGCSRHYTGSVSAGEIVVAPGFTGSVDVQCDPLLMTRANAAKIKAEIAAAKAEVVVADPPAVTPH